MAGDGVLLLLLLFWQSWDLMALNLLALEPLPQQEKFLKQMNISQM
jgi:hypothetical protein